MWFSLSQAGMAKITTSREHFSLGTQGTRLAITPADRNGANNPIAPASIFGRRGFSPTVLSGYPILHPAGHLCSSLQTEDVAGAPSSLRQTCRSARSWQSWCRLHHTPTCRNRGGPKAVDSEGWVNYAGGAEGGQRKQSSWVQEAPCQALI